MKLTPDQLKEIRERAGKATKGPWTCSSGKFPEADEINEGYKGVYYLIEALPEMLLGKANGDFIGAARTDIPSLLDHIEELERELDIRRQLTARHYEDECLTCREEDTCKHKQLLEELTP